ncbi:MAG: type II toxin-antitoxin system VapB family antitoxin [Chloroflexi bacterium]|jgi:antitoxin VapB|nr:type II toxin-antitoxin system VapB family antitoxin [Bacteroidota bacterium]MBT4003033.1 type II toxin-antitoxin system VapB family antitoxin [Chloroflexota bacterium]
MAISIRNEKTEKLAREVALLTGENLTQTITLSLEERLNRLKGRKTTIDLKQEIMLISDRCKSLPDIDPRTPNEILGYDQDGVC